MATLGRAAPLTPRRERDAVELPQVRGFRFGAAACGIKQVGRLDLGLAVAERPAAAAGVFTRNRLAAAPVALCRERLPRGAGTLQAIVVNSGNANACTGPHGGRDAERTASAIGRQLGLAPELVAVCSTGVIGQRLPIDRLVGAVPALAADLGAQKLDRLAHAILTTDKGPKSATATVDLGRAREAIVVGVAKGAGMIAPDMATTLAFLFTDAPATPAFLRDVLRAGADATFNCALVDGDTSTNDTLLLLASGAAGGAPLAADRGAGGRLRAAVAAVLEALIRQIVADGEGAEHLVEVRVEGAPSPAAARAVARRIAGSPLVKTALFGCDPNWGRIACAVGNSGVDVDPAALEIDVGDVALVRKGAAVGGDADARAHEVMQRPEYALTVRLRRGRAGARALTCDLGHAYVDLNADYRS